MNENLLILSGCSTRERVNHVIRRNSGSAGATRATRKHGLRWCDTTHPVHVHRSDVKRPKYSGVEYEGCNIPLVNSLVAHEKRWFNPIHQSRDTLR